jgi:hypothetical protein
VLLRLRHLFLRRQAIGLDGEFVFKTLLAPGSALQLVNITDPANLTEGATLQLPAR